MFIVKVHLMSKIVGLKVLHALNKFPICPQELDIIHPHIQVKVFAAQHQLIHADARPGDYNDCQELSHSPHILHYVGCKLGDFVKCH